MKSILELNLEAINTEYQKIEDKIYQSNDISEIQQMIEKLKNNQQLLSIALDEDKKDLDTSKELAPELVTQIDENIAVKNARLAHIESCYQYALGKIELLTFQAEESLLPPQPVTEPLKSLNSTQFKPSKPSKSWVTKLSQEEGGGRKISLGNSRGEYYAPKVIRTGSEPGTTQQPHVQSQVSSTQSSHAQINAAQLRAPTISERKPTITTEDKHDTEMRLVITNLANGTHKEKNAKVLAKEVESLSARLFSKITLASIKGAGGSLKDKDQAAVFKAQNPSLYQYINFSDQLYHSVLQNIKNTGDDSEKRKVIRTWFAIAEELKNNRDYNSFSQVAAALADCPDLKAGSKIRSKLEKNDEASLKLFESYKDPFDHTFFNEQKIALKADLPTIPSGMVLRKIFAQAAGDIETEFSIDFLNTKTHLADSKIESIKNKIAIIGKELGGKIDNKKTDILEKRVELNQLYNELFDFQKSKTSVLADFAQRASVDSDKQKYLFGQQDLLRSQQTTLKNQQDNLGILQNATLEGNTKNLPIDQTKITVEVKNNTQRLKDADSQLSSIDHQRSLIRIKNITTDSDMKLEIIELARKYSNLIKAESKISSSTAAEKYGRDLLNLKDLTQSILLKPNFQHLYERKEIEKIDKALTEKIELKEVKKVNLLETLRTKPTT